MLRSLRIVLPVVLLVALLGILAVRSTLPIGPIVLGLAAIPLAVLALVGRRLSAAVPDLVFGGLDTGLLAIPALWGGITLGVAGAVAGSVIGDALTDAVAGFFEGQIAEWLRARGFEESREATTTALGKMSGCLLGSGLVLCGALLLGIRV